MRGLPSGRQYTIVHGADRATVVEVGGGLRSYVAGGRELLDGYAEDEMAASARGQPLIPWPDRLRDGRYTRDGRTHQASLSEPEKVNTIQGFLWFANLTCLGQTTSRVDLGHVLHPRPGYPFTLEARLSYVKPHAHLARFWFLTSVFNFVGAFVGWMIYSAQNYWLK